MLELEKGTNVQSNKYQKQGLGPGKGMLFMGVLFLAVVIIREGQNEVYVMSDNGENQECIHNIVTGEERPNWMPGGG